MKSVVPPYISTLRHLGLSQTEQRLSLALLFFYASGIVAHLSPAIYPFTRYITDFFLLLVNGTLLWWLWHKSRDKRLLWWALLAYCGTFAIEAMGVASGKIFGQYTYGSTMQVQYLGVPLVIALNWTVLMLAVNNLAQRITNIPWLAAAMAGGIIAVYDFFIEPVAVKLDYWQWADNRIPFQNYLAWALIAFLFSLPVQYLRIPCRHPLLLIYLAIQWLFFVILWWAF